jgi:hypothetical protein
MGEWVAIAIGVSLLCGIVMLQLMARASKRYDRQKAELGREPTEAELCKPESAEPAVEKPAQRKKAKRRQRTT